MSHSRKKTCKELKANRKSGMYYSGGSRLVDQSEYSGWYYGSWSPKCHDAVVSRLAGQSKYLGYSLSAKQLKKKRLQSLVAKYRYHRSSGRLTGRFLRK